MKNKKCNKCNITKDYKFFAIKKTSKDGYSGICKECKKEYDKVFRENNSVKLVNNRKNNYLKNKNKINEHNKLYKIENAEKIKKYQDEYRLINKEEAKIYQKQYREKNKAKRNLKEKNRKKSDPLYKLTCNLRVMLCDIFKKNGYNKNSKTEEVLGCSFQEFKSYIESKFEIWMKWENHGFYNGELSFGWDIDHIIPLVKAKSEKEIIKLNHYTNLQPLCSHINRDIKKDKIAEKDVE